MKTRLLILVMVFAAGLMITSCTSSRAGCKATAGYIGYGSR